MDIVYPDYNCFQRFADDPTQVRILMEALACEELFARAARDELQLVWSFMHDDEAAKCPFPERREASLLLAAGCAVSVRPSLSIRTRAAELQAEARLSAPDAVHLACAEHARASCLVTCDDQFVTRASRASHRTAVMNPVAYIAGRPRNV